MTKFLAIIFINRFVRKSLIFLKIDRRASKCDINVCKSSKDAVGFELGQRKVI